MKILLIHLLDMIDNWIFRHKIHYVCEKVAASQWWGAGDCHCFYCGRFKK